MDDELILGVPGDTGCFFIDSDIFPAQGIRHLFPIDFEGTVREFEFVLALFFDQFIAQEGTFDLLSGGYLSRMGYRINT